MVSKKIAVIIALLVISSILGGTAAYFNHYSKMKSFHVFPANNFSSKGQASNLLLPYQVSIQTQGLSELGSAWVKISGSDMEFNGYLFAYYNETGNFLDYISIVSQKAMNNFSIPDMQPAQSIMNGIYSLPAYYDTMSTFFVQNSSISMFEPDNFKSFTTTGYSTFKLVNTPFLASSGGNTSASVSVHYPVMPNDVSPVRMTMHHSIWSYYDTSTANLQKNDTFYFVSGISIPAIAGNNTLCWDLSAVFLTDQGAFTDHYNVYRVNYSLSVSVP